MKRLRPGKGIINETCNIHAARTFPITAGLVQNSFYSGPNSFSAHVLLLLVLCTAFAEIRWKFFLAIMSVGGNLNCRPGRFASALKCDVAQFLVLSLLGCWEMFTSLLANVVKILLLSGTINSSYKVGSKQ